VISIFIINKNNRLAIVNLKKMKIYSLLTIKNFFTFKKHSQDIHMIKKGDRKRIFSIPKRNRFLTFY
jgi:hypothetical protein